MARGERILYPKELPEKRGNRPRNYYMPERNECLVHRYYYYAYLRKETYEKCLSNLEIEFYITQQTIISILTKEAARVHQIANQSPQLRDLSVKYPHLTWK